MFKKLLSVLCSATVAASVMAWGALCAYADGTTAYGVTTSTSYSGDTKTVTMTSTSKTSTDSNGSWFYIGTVEVTDKLTAVTVKSADTEGNIAGSGTSSVTIGTDGSISKDDYESIFEDDGVVVKYYNTTTTNNNNTTITSTGQDVTTSVKALGATSGSCYLYAWMRNSDKTITVTATYTVDHGVTTTTATDEGDSSVTTVTQTSTSKENTSGGSWFYIGKVEVTDALTKVTITIDENAYGSNATGGAQQDWVDSETGTISNTNYNSLFNGSGNQSNPANAFLKYDSDTATAAHSGDVTSNVTSNKQTDGYCYLYAWVNKGSIPVTVTATYDTTPAAEGTFAAAAWVSTNDAYEVDSGTTNILTHKLSGTTFYGYSATVTTTGSGSYSSATIYDSEGTKKGSYDTPTITGSGTETVFYLITKSAIAGYTVKVD